MVVCTDLPIARAVTFTFTERPLGFGFQEQMTADGRLSCVVDRAAKEELHEIISWHVIKVGGKDVSSMRARELRRELAKHSGDIKITFGLLSKQQGSPTVVRQVVQQSSPTLTRAAPSTIQAALTEIQTINPAVSTRAPNNLSQLELANIWTRETIAAIDELGSEPGQEYGALLQEVQVFAVHNASPPPTFF